MSHAPAIETAADARRRAADSEAGIFDWTLVVALVALVALAVRAIAFTPTELRQGLAQKIFYIHVPSAFVALYVAFPIMALCSGIYLWLHDDRLDRLAESSAEVGLMFATIVLVTGPIWARTVWGTWWTWDARLTLTLFLWFIILGYLVLRGAIEEPGMRARYSAVLAIMAAILIPFIHLSVYMFRTLHPRPIILKPSAPSLPREMLHTFELGFVAMLLLYVALVRARYRLAALREQVEEHDAR
jgi:heme exporter protein C